MLPWMTAEPDEFDEVFAADPRRYGADANRATLETLVKFVYGQELMAKPMPVDEIFVPVR